MSGYGGYGSGGYGRDEQQPGRQDQQYGSGYNDDEPGYGGAGRPAPHGRTQQESYGGGGYGDGRPQQVGYGGGGGGGGDYIRPPGGYGGAGGDGYGGAGYDERYGERPQQGGARPPQGGYDGARPPQSGYGGGEDYDRPPQGGYSTGGEYGRQGHGRGSGSAVQGQALKIFCEANPDYCLTVKNDQLVLAPGDENAPEQQFVKDCKWGSRVQDSAGFAAFAIVHKASGLALKHGSEMNDRVTLAPYEGEELDESLLWTQSAEVGDGYQCLRPVGDVHLNLDALHGEQGVHKPTELILFKWKKQPNQKWKMVPIGGGGGYSDY